MRAILPIVLASLLLTPATSRGDEISFRASGGELAVSFGLDPFRMSEELDLSGDVFGLDGGSVLLVSGPLFFLDVDEDNGFTSYGFGPGTIQIDASWTNPDGSGGQGTFVATTLSFFIDVCEGCDDLFGGGLADDFDIDLGPGTFDEDFARFLGVESHSVGGFIPLGLEAIGGDPTDRSRSGFSHTGFADVFVSVNPAPVPEPGLLLLGLTCGAAWVARGRRVP